MSCGFARRLAALGHVVGLDWAAIGHALRLALLALLAFAIARLQAMMAAPDPPGHAGVATIAAAALAHLSRYAEDPASVAARVQGLAAREEGRAIALVLNDAADALVGAAALLAASPQPADLPPGPGGVA